MTRRSQQAGVDRLLLVYDEAGHLIGEYLKQGSGFITVQEYIWLGDLPVGVLKNGQLYRIYADHLNTPRVVADRNDNVVWSWESNPYGYIAPKEGGVDAFGNEIEFSMNLRFPGQYYDQETGLHYNYFRTYDPATGRYLETDPIGLAGGMNLYGYASGRPTVSTDPLGLFQVIAMTNRGGGSGDATVYVLDTYTWTDAYIEPIKRLVRRWSRPIDIGVRVVDQISHEGAGRCPGAGIFDDFERATACYSADQELRAFYESFPSRQAGYPFGTRLSRDEMLAFLEDAFDIYGGSIYGGTYSLNQLYPSPDEIMKIADALLEERKANSMPGMRDYLFDPEK